MGLAACSECGNEFEGNASATVLISVRDKWHMICGLDCAIHLLEAMKTVPVSDDCDDYDPIVP